MKFITTILFLFFFLSISLPNAFANTLTLTQRGDVIITSQYGSISLLYQPSLHKIHVKNVLGTSSGVTITVSLSQFVTPTPTPIPSTSLGSSTPTSSAKQNSPIPSTPASSPNITQSNVAGPTPSPTIIATVTTPTSSSSQTTNKVTQDLPNGDSFVITPSADGKLILFQQSGVQATTIFPIQLNSQTKTLQTVIAGISYDIASPARVIQTIKTIGTYIIPSSIYITLISVGSKPVYQVIGKQHVQIFNTFIIDFPITVYMPANDVTKVQVENPLRVTVLEFLHIGKRVIQ